jgi:hypothetical protein
MVLKGFGMDSDQPALVFKWIGAYPEKPPPFALPGLIDQIIPAIVK